MSTSKVALLGAIFLLLLFVAQEIFFVRANSQTIDEAMHITAGYSYLAKRDFRIEPQNPPLIKEFLTSRSSWATGCLQSRSSTLAGRRWLLDWTGLSI